MDGGSPVNDPHPSIWYNLLQVPSRQVGPTIQYLQTYNSPHVKIYSPHLPSPHYPTSCYFSSVQRLIKVELKCCAVSNFIKFCGNRFLTELVQFEPVLDRVTHFYILSNYVKIDFWQNRFNSNQCEYLIELLILIILCKIETKHRRRKFYNFRVQEHIFDTYIFAWLYQDSNSRSLAVNITSLILTIVTRMLYIVVKIECLHTKEHND